MIVENFENVVVMRFKKYSCWKFEKNIVVGKKQRKNKEILKNE